ncbi:hypothetical protein [Campylobacter concisus]|uniref:hypothetical protein n=1 Tax=Campylobacter concisus TaxID=199 RepID=UPI000CD8ABA7|nr:hypothetical protein [Campylobacter concisus]
MKISNLIVFCTILFLFSGCVAPQFTPKPLLPDSKGIAMVNSTPYNCKVLGEAEGSDEANGRMNPTIEGLRQGAMNDLKNEAIEIVGLRKRVVLYIVNELPLCYYGQNLDICPRGSQFAASYRIKAQIFDCGDKN